MPPTVTTAKDRTKSSVALRSILECLSMRAMVRRSLFGRLQDGTGAGDRLFGALVALDGHPDVPGHDQAARQVHGAAERTQHVVGHHRGDGLGERVDQEAL